MSRSNHRTILAACALAAIAAASCDDDDDDGRRDATTPAMDAAACPPCADAGGACLPDGAAPVPPITDPTTMNAAELTERGREIFRFDTFGDEAFWGGQLRLH
ncbi:MAG TPA: hypothetical protein VIL20_06805, partial [Sandaracinaceae bacterium]